MLTSLALIFLTGLLMAALCQQIRLPRIIGYGNCSGALCPESSGFADSFYFCGSAENGFDYYSFKGRSFPESVRLKKSRTSGGNDGFCAGKL